MKFTNQFNVVLKSCIILLLFPILLLGQTEPNGLNCVNAFPFCSDASYDFPNLVGANPIIGPDYGCLSQQPNSVWYYFKVGDAGTFQFLLEQNNLNGQGIDIDFAMWGPFSDLGIGCGDVMSGNTPPIQCSYSSSYTEIIGIGMTGGSDEFGNGESTPPAAESGDYYILVLTNFSGEEGYIQLTQTAGTGTTDCSIVLPCELTKLTVNIQNCDSLSGTFSATGVIEFEDAPDTGTLIVEDCSGNSVSYSAPFSSPLNYVLPDLPADGSNCFIQAYFSDMDDCEIQKLFIHPENCHCEPPELEIESLFTCSPTITNLNHAILPDSDPGNYSFYTSEENANNKIYGINHFVNESGTYWVRAESIGNPNCYSVYEIQVEVVVLTFTYDKIEPFCEDNNGEITLHVNGGEPDYTYSIDNNETQQGTNVFTDLEAGIYDVYVTDANGCAVKDTIILNNENAPVIDSAFYMNPTCSGYCDGEIELFVSGGTPAYDFVWLTEEGDTLPYQEGHLTELCASTSGTVFEIHVVDANHCKSFYWLMLVRPTPINAYFILQDFCGKESGVATNLATTDGVFSIVSPLGDGAEIDAQTGKISNAVEGTTYTVVHEVMGECTSSFTRLVTALNGPDFSLEVEDPLCFINDGSILVDAIPTGAFPFEYAINGGEYQESPLFENVSGGEYIVSVRDTMNCISTDTIVVADFEGPILKIGSSNVVSPTCYGDCDGEIAIEITGGTPDYTVQWYGNDGMYLGLSETVLTELCADSYSVEVRDSNDCVAMAKITLIEPAIPDASFKFDDFCENEKGIPYSVATLGGTFTFLSSVDDGAEINSITGEISGGVGGAIYLVNYQTAAPCTENFSHEVHVFNAPIAEFVATPIIGVPPLTVEIENTSLDADSYFWSFGDGQESTTNAINFSHVYTDFGSYPLQLIAYTENSCNDTLQQLIEVIYDSIRFEFPNVFTPNGDGDNDLFKLIFGENFTSFEIVILNRWGNIVFESEDVLFRWNGQVHNVGNKCSEGVYFYKVKMKDALQQDVKVHGFVHLLR